MTIIIVFNLMIIFKLSNYFYTGVIMLSWEGISEFVAVAEQASFTKAANELGLSIAQVSRQVSALENRLAIKLLYRTTRSVSVTEPGQLYYQQCRQLLDGLEEAERSLQHLHNEPRGKLKITAPTTYGESHIAPLLNQFLHRYPNLDIQFRMTNQKVDLTEAGFDLAIRLGQLDDSSMMAKKLATRNFFICASKQYIKHHGIPKTPSQLNQHNCLRGIHDYWRFNDKDKDRSITVTGNYSCNSGSSLRDAALKGIGIIQLPDYYVQTDIENGDLQVLLPDYQPRGDGIWALYPQNRHLSAKVRTLVDYLAENLSNS
jgi:DNA-binding transcriptional LysR family regulator